MAATLTTTRTTEFSCGCVGTYEGPLGSLVSMAQCEGHIPAWQREGFVPAPLQSSPVTEGWEELFLATYAEVSKGWPL
jgi:hypothetical protein